MQADLASTTRRRPDKNGGKYCPSAYCGASKRVSRLHLELSSRLQRHLRRQVDVLTKRGALNESKLLFAECVFACLRGHIRVSMWDRCLNPNGPAFFLNKLGSASDSMCHVSSDPSVVDRDGESVEFLAGNVGVTPRCHAMQYPQVLHMQLLTPVSIQFFRTTRGHILGLRPLYHIHPYASTWDLSGALPPRRYLLPWYDCSKQDGRRTDAIYILCE
jgi:hypothetical protein